MEQRLAPLDAHRLGDRVVLLMNLADRDRADRGDGVGAAAG
jgi:hypothetical protein